MANPFISFVVPVYNREKILEQTVESILDTTYDDYEVVLVDNASQDGSGVLCDRLMAEHPQIRVLHLPVNVGAGGARNVGLDHARGVFLHFCDSDDAVDGSMLPKIALRLRENPDVDLLTTNHREQTKDGSHTVSILEEEERCSVDHLLEEKPSLLHLSFWRNFYRRSFILEHQLRFPSIREHEDLYFNGLALLHAEKAYVMPDVFYQYNRFVAANSIVAQSSAGHSADGFDACTAAFRSYLHEFGIQGPKARAADGFVYASAMLILGGISPDTLCAWDHSLENLPEKAQPIDLALSGKVGIRGCVASLWRQIAECAQRAIANQRPIYLAPAGNISISIARMLLEKGIGVCGLLDNSVKKDNFHIKTTVEGNRFSVESFENFFTESAGEKGFVLITGSINTALSISRQLDGHGWVFGDDYRAFIR